MLQSYVVVVLMLVCYKNVNVRRTDNNGERKSEHDIVARLRIIYKGGLTQRHAFGKYYNIMNDFFFLFVADSLHVSIVP